MNDIRFTKTIMVKRTLKCITLAWLTALISGCTGGSLFDRDVPTVVTEHSAASFDVMTSHSPLLSFKGYTDDDNEEAEVLLRAHIEARKPVKYYLEVKAAYEGHWRNYIGAVDNDGKVFQSSATENHVRCELFCWFHDTVEVIIPDAYLWSHQDKGATFWLLGPATKSGLALNLPADYIKTFLNRLSTSQK